jgi:hypothetical protein
MNFRSSVNKKGKIVDQIIHFAKGNKRTLENIRTETIKQGEFTNFELTDGRMILINTLNVDMIEVFPKEEPIEEVKPKKIKTSKIGF